MRKIIRLSAIILSIVPGNIQAQTTSNEASSSLYFISSNRENSYDTSEHASIDLGTATFSTADKRIAMNYYGYFIPRSGSSHHRFISISGGGAAKNTTATILSNNQIVGEGDADFRAGYRVWNNKNKYEEIEELYRHGASNAVIQGKLNKLKRSDIWFIGSLGVAGSSFKLYYPTNTFDEQIKRQSYTSKQVNVGVNYWTSRLMGGTLLAGATIGIQYSDNFDELDESTKEDTHLEIDPTSGTNRKITTKETVYLGTYKTDIITFPVNYDIYFAPDRLGNLALLATGNTVYTDGGITKTKLGFGFFILKDNNPTIPIGGIVLSYADVFNADKTDDAKSKFSIALTTRVNLLKRTR